MGYLSTVDYLSDGTQTVFGVPFPYINTAYVKVYKKSLWGTDGYSPTPIPVAFTWQTPNTIQISAVVPKGWTVRVRRETEVNKNLVRFNDQSMMAQKHLDLQELQHLHLIQELHDRKLEIDVFEHTINDLEDRMVTQDKLDAVFKELDEKKADKSALEAAIKELKAADAALDAKKADKTELKEAVDALDAKKADRTELDAAVEKLEHADAALDAKKADKTKVNEVEALAKKHASRHAKGGEDPLTPQAIGAIPIPDTPVGPHRYLGHTGAGDMDWIHIDDFPKARYYGWGVSRPDNKTIKSMDGVLGLIGVVGEGGKGPSEANVSEVQYIVCDGVETEYEITHTLGSSSVVVQTYNDDTGERVWFKETTVGKDKILLSSAEPVKDGTCVRIVMIAPKVSTRDGDGLLELTPLGEYNPNPGAATLFFLTDGVSKAYELEHELDTNELVIQTVDDSTGERVYFQERTAGPDKIVLSTAEPLPEGITVRVVVLCAGSCDGDHEPEQPPMVDGRKEFFFTQDEPVLEWHITHSLDCKYPNILVLDNTGQRIYGAEDWLTNTVNYICISFSVPTSGRAIIST